MFGCLAYVHAAKDKRGKLDPKTHPCVFLGYGDDEFGYRLCNLSEKKVIRSRDIVFVEEKNISDWESENKTTSSESTDRDRLEETRVYPDGIRTTVEEQYEPTEFGQETKSTRRDQNAETGQDLESNSDEELIEEPVVENQGQRYPL